MLFFSWGCPFHVKHTAIDLFSKRRWTRGEEKEGWEKWPMTRTKLKLFQYRTSKWEFPWLQNQFYWSLAILFSMIEINVHSWFSHSWILTKLLLAKLLVWIVKFACGFFMSSHSRSTQLNELSPSIREQKDVRFQRFASILIKLYSLLNIVEQ